jgi:hypothetical protein
VEVKRSCDTRIRREVVGQMLDYAANAVAYWPVETLRAQFETSCQRRGVDADQELASFLGPEDDPVLFWQQVKTNLQAGKIRLLFVADEIPSELRQIVEFLNQQMDPAEVLAIEIKQYTGTGGSTLVPTVVGQTAQAQQRKAGPLSARRQWDEPSFFQTLQQTRTAPEIETARAVLDWARTHATQIWWGKGQHTGSFVPIVHHGGIDHQLFAVYTYGTVEIYFQWYQYKPPFEDEANRLELLRRLNAIDGVSIPADAITRRPNIPLAVLAEAQCVAAFLGIFEWFIHEVQTL